MAPLTYRPQPQRRKSGLLVTDELSQAIERCRNKVKSLAAECRRNNRKFTDIEFDLSSNWWPCVYSLSGGANELIRPTDVRRVTDIFEKPMFFDGGATASDISQGYLGDCWFLSALAVVASAGLIEKICVERDEQVGIYGFIFWRDSGWVDVVIDDYLCTKLPPWESLSGREQMIYHNSREKYTKNARRGGQNLLFARSATDNETWVPLLEKAYAKLHGDYESIDGGWTAEGIEDLTGAVSTTIYLKDILDPDRFWKEELMQVGIDRVFACGTPGAGEDVNSDGLVSGHAYALLKAVEHEGRRFLVIRNPWGSGEWSGRWSDGSKEWNDEFAVGLKKALGDFKFGDDGEFVQEYDDFLQVWEDVDRNRLFDDQWIVNSQWLGFYPVNHMTWSHGDITFTISVDSTTEAVICLAQMDTRYFKELSGQYAYRLDFTLYKKGETTPIGHSLGNQNGRRSVKMQAVLEAGEYVVQVRIGREKARETPYDFSDFSEEKLARKRTEWATSKSIATNFDPSSTSNLPLPPSLFAGLTLLELQLEAQEKLNALREKQQARKKANAAAKEALEKAKAEAEAKANGEAEGDDKEEGKEEDEKKEEVEEEEEKKEEVEEKVKEPEVVEESPEEEEEEEEGEQPSRRKRRNRKNRKRNGFFNKAMEAAKRARFSATPYAAADGDSGSEEEGDGEGEDANDSDYNSEDAARDAGVPILMEEEEPEPHEFECSECTEQIKGILYHCMEVGCINYNVCEDCKKFEDHPTGHTFIKFTSSEDAQAIVQQNDDGGDGELVLGLRVYTQKSVPAAVRGQIRKGSILRKHYLKK
ncbi:hypothetical protein M407DRAFT_241888 [Tulasnella calospora MUT 4182]|uniref:Calpain catalytic domain-containing protein n=1 Tax=Tulasnella calospora MUT 4182 TaxID=1051891 RepID=A0A0C3LBD0_9AGAM|nr:hypothetical protein M407DRAFT_241888 [Tulasnella calospora MUT 4182]